MESLTNLFNHGLRGTFYTVKRICSTTFFLCLGILLGVLLVTIKPFASDTDRENFFIAFVVILFASLLLWIVFRWLHNRWVAKHFTSAKADFVKALQQEGIISEEVRDKALTKL